MSLLSQILSDANKVGICKVNAHKNGILECVTVSTGKTWYMPTKSFAKGLTEKTLSIVSEEDNTFKFVSKTAQELFNS